MKVVVIGLGLIGGSFAKDITALHPGTGLLGIDHNEAHVREALELGIIDGIGDGQALADADLVIVAIPVNALLGELPKILDRVGDDTVVLDGGSTKRLICAAVE